MCTYIAMFRWVDSHPTALSTGTRESEPHDMAELTPNSAEGENGPVKICLHIVEGRGESMADISDAGVVAGVPTDTFGTFSVSSFTYNELNRYLTLSHCPSVPIE